MEILLSRQALSEIDLSSYLGHINRNDHKKNFVAPPGENHYYLLAYLSSQINNSTIIELGTHHGTGTLALSLNKSNKVITYDVRDVFGIKPQPENVQRVIGNIFKLQQQSLLLESALIFLDTAHLGDFEWQVYSFLLENNYRGILLLDDIHWNKPMKEFWSKIDTLKYDVTNLGHGVCPDGLAGTGLVDFSGQVVIS